MKLTERMSLVLTTSFETVIVLDKPHKIHNDKNDTYGNRTCGVTWSKLELSLRGPRYDICRG